MATDPTTIPSVEDLQETKGYMEDINEFVNSENNSLVDSDGKTRRTLTGINSEFDSMQSGELTKIAADAADRAETAADVAVLNAGVYADTTDGLLSTVDGEYFSVVSSENDEYLLLYLNNAGEADFQKKYPSTTALEEVLNTVEPDVESYHLLKIEDSNGNTIVSIDLNGSLYIPKIEKSIQETIEDIENNVQESNSLNLYEFHDSNGDVIATITNDGKLFLTGLGGKAIQDLITSNQGAELLNLKDSNGNTYFFVDSNGEIKIKGSDKTLQELLGLTNEEPPFTYTENPPTVIIGESHPSPASQRVPAAARTGNKSWACWYSNDTEIVGEEGPGDYVNIAFSDDNWQTNTEYAVIRYDQAGDEDKRVFDPQMWVDQDGLLWIIFSVAGNDTKFDGVFGVWAVTVKNPEADFPQFSTPFRLSYYGIGMLPTIINEQVYIPVDYWRISPLYPNEAGKRVHKLNPKERSSDYLSTLPESVQSSSFDETYIVQLSTGRIMAAYRTAGSTERCFSDDNGETWSSPETWAALGVNTSSRIWLGYSPTGRLIVCYNNSPSRNNLQLKISEDDGETFPYSVQISNVTAVSYPSLYFYDNGEIAVVYDQNRTTDKIINVGIVNEQDVVDGVATVTTRIISDK